MRKKILFTLMLAIMPVSHSLQASSEGCGCFSSVSKLLKEKIGKKIRKNWYSTSDRKIFYHDDVIVVQFQFSSTEDS